MRIAILFAALFAFAVPARANPCSADALKFCKDVRAGGGRIIRCLKEHESELSEGCKAMQRHGEEKADEFRHCKADAEKLCKDVKPGGGRIVRCLREHDDELSAQCKKGLPPEEGKKAAPAQGHDDE